VSNSGSGESLVLLLNVKHGNWRISPAIAIKSPAMNFPGSESVRPITCSP